MILIGPTAFAAVSEREYDAQRRSEQAQHVWPCRKPGWELQGCEGCRGYDVVLLPALASADDETWEAIDKTMTTTWSFKISYSKWFDQVIAKIRHTAKGHAREFKMKGNSDY